MELEDLIREWTGRRLIDTDGREVGRIEELFVDETTGRPKWAMLGVRGRAPRSTFVPIGDADAQDDAVRVAIARQRVLDSPAMDPEGGRLTHAQEDELERHYAGAAERPTEVVTSERPEVVRSEEELVLERRRVPYERVRLVKRVVTETVTQTYEVRREELHVERLDEADAHARAETPDGEPTAGGLRSRVAGAVAGRLDAVRGRSRRVRDRLGGGAPPFTGETLDLTLYEEQVMVTKRVVPRERVRLRKELVTSTREVSDTLRKEQVDIEPAQEARPQDAS